MTKKVLTSEEFRTQAEILISEANSHIKIFSGFIKSSGVQWLREHINNSIEVTLIGRFSASDLIKGASDLDVYSICKELGWKLGVLNNLHSKVFIFDDKHLMLGSANLTMRGLSIEGYGNIELGTELLPSAIDLKRIESMQEDVIWIDDGLYEAMKKEIDSFDIKENEQDTFSWSGDLINKLQPSDPNLWVKDLLHSDPEIFMNMVCSNNKTYPNLLENKDIRLINFITQSINDLGGEAELEEIYKQVNRYRKTPNPSIRARIYEHSSECDAYISTNPDLFISSDGKGKGKWRTRYRIESTYYDEGIQDIYLLNNDFYSLIQGMDKAEIQIVVSDLFKKTKIFNWLVQLIDNHHEHTHKNFGWVTTHLHDALMDDPCPSRGGIKFFVNNLFKWVEAFGGDEIKITHYERTTSLELLNKKDIIN